MNGAPFILIVSRSAYRSLPQFGLYPWNRYTCCAPMLLG